MKTKLNAPTVKALIAFTAIMRTAEVSHKAELARAEQERLPSSEVVEGGKYDGFVRAFTADIGG